MVVNGFQLPLDFERIYEAIERGGWNGFRLNEDAYGNPFGRGLEIWPSLMEERDAEMIDGFSWLDDLSPAEVQRASNDHVDQPGFIPLIADFAEIVWFAQSGAGDPYCFDFRDDPQEPSIIYSDDVYWRRLAPSFGAFLELLELDTCSLEICGERDRPRLEEAMRRTRSVLTKSDSDTPPDTT